MQHPISHLYHQLEEFWEGPHGERFLALWLVGFYSLFVMLILLGGWGMLPASLAERLPHSPLKAIEVAFNILLVFEVVGLCFSLPGSFSRTVGKQFQIFSLILLRNSFKDITHLVQPFQWEEMQEVIPGILSNSLGALVIFVLIGIFSRLHRQRPLTKTEKETAEFIHFKQIIALLLLAGFLGMVVRDLYRAYYGLGAGEAFYSLYSFLIFGDIFMMLISLHYSSCYHAAFRNSGYALSTVVLRFALTAPVFINSILGVVSAIFVLAICYAYNKLAPDLKLVTKL